MTEEHIFNQIFWHRSAVKRNKRAIIPGGCIVQYAGQNFFTDASGAGKQNGDINLRHPLGKSQQVTTYRVGKYKGMLLLILGNLRGDHSLSPFPCVKLTRRHHGHRTLSHRLNA